MFNGKMTYLVALIIIIYAIVARGYGANDWNTASILIAVAIVGVSLKMELHKEE
jgi:hypothetical protein